MITLEMANKELKRIEEFLKETSYAWNTTYDLKLHDAYWYLFSELENDFPLCYANHTREELFERFCDEQYQDFMLELKEMGEDKSIFYHVGRTSKFYIGTYFDSAYGLGLFNIYTDLETFDNIDIDIVDNKLELMLYGNATLESENTQMELEDFMDNAFNDIEKSLENIIAIANIIKTAKEQQVINLKYYLLNIEEYEQEQEMAKIARDFEQKRTLLHKSIMLDGIMEKTKEQLATYEIQLLQELKSKL